MGTIFAKLFHMHNFEKETKSERKITFCKESFLKRKIWRLFPNWFFTQVKCQKLIAIFFRSRGSQSAVRRQTSALSEEDEEEEGNEATNANDNSEATSDCSLDESDFSSADSTTEVSSEHSDWGSDHENKNEDEPLAGSSSRAKRYCFL